MNFLLIDTSSACVEFGYSRDGSLFYTYKNCEKNSADSLAYRVNRFFIDLKFEPASTDAVVLSNGPGSFTGLRIGSAFAKGFCLATGCRLIQINSLDVLALAAGVAEVEFLTAINSNSSSGELYYSTYRISKDKLNRTSPYSISDRSELEAKTLPLIVRNGTDEESDNNEAGYHDHKSNLHSLLKLAKISFDEGEFAELSSAEPFYMKDFTVRK